MYNVVIAEDEYYLHDLYREWIEEISDEYRVIGTFFNGKDAMEFIQNNKVDLLITDIKMPVMDGLELIKYINDNNLAINVIITSGYEDFEYARQAIRYNVFYYLVKVFDFEEFAEVMLNMKKVLDEKKQRENDLPNAFEDARERFFTELFCGCFENNNEIRISYEKLGFKNKFEDTLCSFYEIIIDHYENMIENKWQYGKDSYEQALTEFLERVFDENENDIDIYIVSFENNTINAIILDKNGNNFSSFITEKIKSFFNIDVMVTQKNEPCTINRLKEYSGQIDKEMMFKMIVTYANVGSADKIRLMINNMYKNLDERNFDDIMDIDGKKIIQSKENGVTKEKNDDEVVILAKEYINKNYSKDISRNDIASCTYITPKYLSSIFKNKTGMTMSDYLLQVRMGKAIELLHTDLKFHEIAEQVGLKNSRNFRRAFINFTGYSPSDYKKMIYINGVEDVNK